MRRFALGLVPFTFLLFACGDDTTAPAGTEASAPVTAPGAPVGAGGDVAGRSGIVASDDGDYAFTPTTCVVHEGEVEVAGPGTDPDGGKVFVKMSAGEGYANLRIDPGTDSEFTSSDEILISGDLDVEISGSAVSGTGALRDGSGGQDSVPVTFDINCG